MYDDEIELMPACWGINADAGGRTPLSPLYRAVRWSFSFESSRTHSAKLDDASYLTATIWSCELGPKLRLSLCRIR